MIRKANIQEVPEIRRFLVEFSQDGGILPRTLADLYSQLRDYYVYREEQGPILGKKEFELMKKGVVIINCARGGAVDEAVLLENINAGKVAGAGLDVYEVEPLPASSPLLRLDNVVLAPHMAGDTADARRRMGEITVENIVRVMRGEPPLSPVE